MDIFTIYDTQVCQQDNTHNYIKHKTFLRKTLTNQKAEK